MTCDLLISSIAFIRMVLMSARPFDTNQLIYLHCIDLSTKKYVPTAGFSCFELCSMLGHFSFIEGLNIFGEFVVFCARQRVK